MDPRLSRGLWMLAMITVLTSITFAAPSVVVAADKLSPESATVVTLPATPASGDVMALRDAKRVGDVSRVEALHKSLGWMPETAHVMSTESALIMRGPAYRGVPGGPNPLLYDQAVSDPSWASGEPDIACASDGTLYMVVEDLGAQYVDIYNSANGGYTWDYFGSIADVDPKSPSIAVGEGVQDNLLVAYASGSGTASAAIKVWRLPLGGGAATAVTVFAQPFATLSDPRMCTDSDEYSVWYPYITWVRSVVGRLATTVEFSRSTDYGVSYTTPMVLATSVPANVEHDVDFGGSTLHVVYTREAGPGNRDVYLRRSTNYGSSFDAEIGIATSAGDEYEPKVGATVDGGMVVIAYTRDYGTDTDVDAYTTTDGTTWNETFLPYFSTDERSVDLAAHVAHPVVHAVYYNDGDINSSWVHSAFPTAWSPRGTVNEGGFAHADHPPAVAANPTRAYEASVGWIVQGPDQIQAYFDAEYPVGDYLLVLGNSSLIPPAESLKEWKAAIGYRVTIVTLEEIFATYPSGDDAERIRSYLVDAANDVRHVMLVGDVDELPMRMLYPSDTRPAYGSDFYYADASTSVWDADGDDRWGEFYDDTFNYHPDLIVGRLPFNDAPTFQTFVNNVIAFEQETASWKRNVLFSHGFMDFGQHFSGIGTDAAYAAQAIINGPLSPVGWGYTRQYEEGGIYTSSFPSEDDLLQTNFRNRLGWGQHGIVSAMAHGNRTHMAGVQWLADLNESFTNDMPEEWTHNWFSHYNHISTDPAVGIVSLWGCGTADLIGWDPCFKESGLHSRYLIRLTRPSLMMKEYLKHGAGAVMGSTAGSDYTGGWTSVSHGRQQSFGYYYLEALTGTYSRAGDALHRAAVKYADVHGLARGIRVFQCFGDPTLTVEDLAVPGGLPRMATGIASVPIITQTASETARAQTPPSCPPSSVDWTKVGELGGALVISGIVGTEGEVLAAGMASDGLGYNRGVVYRSLDLGTTWTRYDVPGAWSIRSIARAGGGRLVASGCVVSGSDVEGVIYTSDDDGSSWTARLAVPGVLITEVVKRATGDLIAVTSRTGSVYRSSNNGTGWELVSSIGAGTSISSVKEISGRLYLTLDEPNGHSPVQRSFDAITWQPATGITTSVAAAYDIVRTWDGSYFLATQNTSNEGRLYGSTDEGASWIELAEPPDLDVRAIHSLLMAPDGLLYIGASTGKGDAGSRVYGTPVPIPIPRQAGDSERARTSAIDVITWEQKGADLDLANTVHAMVVHGDYIFVGTGDLYGGVYAMSHGNSVDVPETTPPAFGLSPSVPNPFASQTAIRYSLPNTTDVALRVFDARGRAVRVLVDTQNREAGTYATEWDGRDDAGRQLPPGVYFYRLETSGGRLNGRVVLAR